MKSGDRSPEHAAPEEHLICQAQGGDRSAQACLVERYWDRLYRWLYQLTHDRHLAEDLTQDSFLKALGALPRFRAGGCFAAWLFRIGHNTLLNHWRRNTRRRELLPEDLPGREPDPAEEVAAGEVLQTLTRAVSRLPEELRAALLLRVEEGLSFREIAQVFDLTEETARWRVFKARQKLLEGMAPRLEREKT